MAEESKKFIVDDDWKAQARREKERLAAEAEKSVEQFPAPSFGELVNLLVMQAMVGFGLVSGPDGRRIPPHLETAKHFIDMLQVLEDKTKNNLTAEEKKLLDQVLYELRLQYVQFASATLPPAPATER